MHYALATQRTDIRFRGPVLVLGLNLATGADTGIPEEVIATAGDTALPITGPRLRARILTPRHDHPRLREQRA